MPTSWTVEAKEPPPRDAHADREWYGLWQPIWAARRIAGDPELLRESCYPALLLALVCAGVAILTTFPGLSTLRRFYQVFVALAPVPTVLLARHYAHLAVLAHQRAGGGPCEPLVEPLGRALKRALMQMVLIAIAVAPVSILVRWVPLVGAVVVKCVAGLWALHWIVINAFEGARVLLPGQTLESLDALEEQTPSPWFVRAMRALGERVPVLGGIATAFARFCDRLAKPWREELRLVEQHPSLAAGFALSTAVLLFTPVLNLFFRPVVLVAASHVLLRLALPCAARRGRGPGRLDEPPASS